MLRTLKSFGYVAAGLLSLCGAKLCADYSCCEPVDYCCDPLACGEWRVSIKGGVAPQYFGDRSRSQLIFGPGAVLPGVVIGDRLPKFNDLFKTPWQLGFEIGYALDCNNEIYVEFAYDKARGKNHNTTADVVVDGVVFPLGVATSLGDYKTYSGYVGWRYHFPSFCWGGGHLFTGLKVGVIERKSINSSVALTFAGITIDVDGDRSFNRDRTVSAGFCLGYNYSFGCGWSASLAIEAVASGAMRNNQRFEFGPITGTLTGLDELVVGRTGTIIEWPITLSLTKSF